MKTGTVILLAVGGLALYFYSELGITAASMNVVFDSVQIKSVTDYMIGLLIQNVSNSPIYVNSLAGDILVNGNELGNISDFSPITVNPNSQQVVQIEIKPSLLSLPGTVIDLVNNSGGNLNFTATGHMNIDNQVLPFNVSKSVTV